MFKNSTFLLQSMLLSSLLLNFLQLLAIVCCGHIATEVPNVLLFIGEQNFLKQAFAKLFNVVLCRIL